MLEQEFAELRKQMVEEQLIPRGINDQRVIQAFQKVPRHRFVAQKYAKNAYADYPLPIGSEQTISQPYIVALMTQALNLSGNETVLEIGTGSGYQAAILAELATQVYSIERVAALAEQAEQRLKDLGYQNTEIKIADGTMGWREHAPYEGIIVTAGAPQIPEPLLEQLKEKGRLVIPVGGRFSQILTLAEKVKAKIETCELCGCIFVPLLGKFAWRQIDA